MPRRFVLLILFLFIDVVAVPRLSLACSSAKKAQFITTKIQIQYLADAVNQYKKEVGELPSEGAGLTALMEKPADLPVDRWHGPYLEKIPIDAWRMPFVYEQKGGSFKIWSYGYDSEPYTDDDITKDSEYPFYEGLYGNDSGPTPFLTILILFIGSILFKIISKIFRSKIGLHPRLDRAATILIIVSPPLLFLFSVTVMC